MPTLRGLAYGPIAGENRQSTTYGPLGRLGVRDVALSPNQMRNYPLGSFINAAINGVKNIGTYRVADPSYVSPGQPTRNTIELRNRNPGGAPVSIAKATNPYGLIRGGIDVFGDYPNPPASGLSGMASRRPLPAGVIPGGINITGDSPSSSYGTGLNNPTPGQNQYFQFLNDNSPTPAPPETSIGQNIPLNDQNVAPVTPPLTPLADTSIGQNIPLNDQNVLPENQDFYYSGSPDMNTPQRATAAPMIDAATGQPMTAPASSVPAPGVATALSAYPLAGGWGRNPATSYDTASGTNWLSNATNQNPFRVPLDANGFPLPGGGPGGPTAPGWASNASRPFGGPGFGNFAQVQNAFIPGLIDWNGPGGTNPLSNEGGAPSRAAARFGLAGRTASARSGLMPGRQL